MNRSIAWLLIACCTVALASGCQRIEEVVQPEPTVVTQEATVVAQGAAVTGSLPEGIPAELPLWPGATVLDGGVADGSVSLILETSDVYDDVVAGTSVGLERAGWTVAQAAEEASATVLDVAGDGYEGVVTISATESSSRIEYLLIQAAE